MTDKQLQQVVAAVQKRVDQIRERRLKIERDRKVLNRWIGRQGVVFVDFEEGKK